MRNIVYGAALAAVLGGSFTASADARELTWGEHLPECCSMYAAALKWMVDEVDKRSDGDLTINVNWGGVLASVGEVPTAVETNIIDLGNVVTPYFPDQFVVNNAIPFFWPQPKSQGELGELMLKWSKDIPAFKEELAKYNLKMVTVRPLPPYGFICTSPLKSLDDFKGKRIRSYGVALPAMIEALGAVPVGMPDVEAYEAMSNNVLDCSAADIALVDAFHLDEVAKYFINVPMGASWGHILVINKDVYDSLSDSQKEVLDSMEEDHLSEMLRLFGEAEMNVRQKWKDEGSVEIVDFPADVFLDATLGNARVQEVRASWKGRAIGVGMPETDADTVVSDITN
ncbi:TRAP transporter substrate-binding protein DctP [Puniceibacterium sp. IMCC21224]|uniref:TRAP transporter substrate-binding protein DctP n=1 Tax=Puniceibacterium sp. IMCC21224 TaxID=1618204 RepID=UPI0018CDFA66|nr:TRAP transporter substrate-binding protein DctP [Puniceibacterium sp. IMCC21224]